MKYYLSILSITFLAGQALASQSEAEIIRPGAAALGHVTAEEALPVAPPTPAAPPPSLSYMAMSLEASSDTSSDEVDEKAVGSASAPCPLASQTRLPQEMFFFSSLHETGGCPDWIQEAVHQAEEREGKELSDSQRLEIAKDQVYMCVQGEFQTHYPLPTCMPNYFPELSVSDATYNQVFNIGEVQARVASFLAAPTDLNEGTAGHNLVARKRLHDLLFFHLAMNLDPMIAIWQYLRDQEKHQFKKAAPAALKSKTSSNPYIRAVLSQSAKPKQRYWREFLHDVATRDVLLRLIIVSFSSNLLIPTNPYSNNLCWDGHNLLPSLASGHLPMLPSQAFIRALLVKFTEIPQSFFRELNSFCPQPVHPVLELPQSVSMVYREESRPYTVETEIRHREYARGMYGPLLKVIISDPMVRQKALREAVEDYVAQQRQGKFNEEIPEAEESRLFWERLFRHTIDRVMDDARRNFISRMYRIHAKRVGLKDVGPQA